MSDGPLFAAEADQLAASNVAVSANERRIYDLVRAARGHKRAVSLKYLCAVTHLSERTVKGCVADLIVTHGVRIGASRGHGDEPAGYFIIDSDEDLEIAALPYAAQVSTMLRRLEVLAGRPRVRTFLTKQVARFSE